MLRSFDNKEKALKFWKLGGNLEAQKQFITNIFYLTGRAGTPDDTKPWEFKLVGSPQDSPDGWEKAEYKPLEDSTWQIISLPGHWQLQGFDIPIYTNTQYPFELDPPRVRRTGKWRVTDCDAGIGGTIETEAQLHPKEPGINSTGLYRIKFSLPEEWNSLKNDRLFIVFEGTDSCLNVWLNNNYVGYGQDSCLPSEFDITDIIR
jgi:beta-galactosidase/beta-glucuronidase